MEDSDTDAVETTRLIHGEEEEETGVPVLPPLLSSLTPALRFGWAFARWPALVLGANVVFFVGTRVQVWYYTDQVSSLNNVCLIVLCVVNAIWLFWAWKIVKKQVRDLNDEQPQGMEDPSFASVSHIYARVSYWLDCLLQRPRDNPPLSTILLQLLPLAIALLVCLALALGVGVVHNVVMCAPQGRQSFFDNQDSLDSRVPIPRVPDQLQEWAMNYHSASAKSYFHSENDGYTFFTARDEGTLELSRINYARFGGPAYQSFLAMVTPDGRLVEFDHLREPLQYIDVGKNGFCCVVNDMGGLEQSTERSLACHVSGQDQKLFNTTLALPVSSSDKLYYYVQDTNIIYYNDQVWIRMRAHNELGRGKEEIFVLTYDPVTDAKTVVLSAYAPPTPVRYEYNFDYDCRRRQVKIVGFAFGISLLLLSAWGLAGLGEAHAISLGPIALSVILDQVFKMKPRTASALYLCSAFGALVGLFIKRPTWMTRELVIWTLYVFLLVASCIDLIAVINRHDPRNPCLVITLWLTTGIVLGHPVLPLMSFTFGMTVLVMILLLLLGKMRSRDAWQIFLLGGLSIGVAALETQLNKYRPSLVYYTQRASRRLWNRFRGGLFRSGSHREP